jgi:hypothetical protein
MKVMAWQTWAQDCLIKGIPSTIVDVISWLEYDPSVNPTAESYFMTKSIGTQKQSETKLDGSLKYNGAT